MRVVQNCLRCHLPSPPLLHCCTAPRSSASFSIFFLSCSFTRPTRCPWSLPTLSSVTSTQRLPTANKSQTHLIFFLLPLLLPPASRSTTLGAMSSNLPSCRATRVSCHHHTHQTSPIFPAAHPLGSECTPSDKRRARKKALCTAIPWWLLALCFENSKHKLKRKIHQIYIRK